MSPPTISRNNSRASSSGGSPVLPPDAVDLVVEDKEADDRRPGPSRLRQVYRRGFVGVEWKRVKLKSKEQGKNEWRRVSTSSEPSSLKTRMWMRSRKRSAGKRNLRIKKSSRVLAENVKLWSHARLLRQHIYWTKIIHGHNDSFLFWSTTHAHLHLFFSSLPCFFFCLDMTTHHVGNTVTFNCIHNPSSFSAS
ncbi:hypothetical protein K435DRAFT_461890 [Dendrothele bispora CBS 962.96]|uniref:Uncharacterized protein n=1 Tax=Dendrothele bispora (strain CBS 962.96) TaxID=1314807 RepID=A0A4S8MD69_DENBC|nr:hypothetical protein K435DRAFT_461890 [Dendrothele bispora CBS 962.96]